jgi:serine/threonine protein kinase
LTDVVTEVDYSVVSAITEDFSAERILGTGSFATVYYGSRYLTDTPPEGWPKSVGVKVDKYTYEGAGVGEQKTTWMQKADQAELSFCGEFFHGNLCKLFGFSVNGPNRCLVFEYCAGGSVKARLRGTVMDKPAGRPFPPLSIGHRFRICAELACALAYLHCGTSTPVFHRDVKPDNVLIDEGGTAKLADFGTIRQKSQRKNSQQRKNSSNLERKNSSNLDASGTMNFTTGSHLTTKNVIGTPFFMPPEYVTSGRVSAKTDAFAMGMFIFVILTNKKLRPSKDADFVYGKIHAKAVNLALTHNPTTSQSHLSLVSISVSVSISISACYLSIGQICRITSKLGGLQSRLCLTLQSAAGRAQEQWNCFA